MDNIFCKSQTKEKIVLVSFILCLLVSCAPVEPQTPLWIRSMETLPKVEGFRQSGVFDINGKIYVQNCDAGGNQIWMRYNEETHAWRQSRYNTLGCVRGENSTGPDAG